MGLAVGIALSPGKSLLGVAPQTALGQGGHTSLGPEAGVQW